MEQQNTNLVPSQEQTYQTIPWLYRGCPAQIDCRGEYYHGRSVLGNWGADLQGLWRE